LSDCVITDRQGIQSHDEPRWTALLAVFVAVVLQLFLPDSLIRALGNRRRIEKTGAFSHLEHLCNELQSSFLWVRR
jgi:hypothetical protein